MRAKVPTTRLAPGLEIARVLNGLWQGADLERDGETLDLANAASAMEPYVEAGFTTFDMADHYGSAEDIAGYFKTHSKHASHAQMLTKWVPKPGRLDRQAAPGPPRHAPPHTFLFRKVFGEFANLHIFEI